MARRPKAQREKDLQIISDLYLRGIQQIEIAKQLGVSQPTISNDLSELQKRWREKAFRNIDEVKSEELAKIDRLELEYWSAWERSCEDAETIKQKGTPSADNDAKKKINTTYVEKTAKGQSGDPRFLTGIQWCIERRCKIIGIDAPERKDITSGGKAFDISMWIQERKDRLEDIDNLPELDV